MTISTPSTLPPPFLVSSALALVHAHHAQYDPSHDFNHVSRVTALSLLIAGSLLQPETIPPVNARVVQLGALFHDLLDAKYLPPNSSKHPTARERLRSYWDAVDAHAALAEIVEIDEEVLEEADRRTVERIMEGVSYSKEMKRKERGEEEGDWESSCRELHCVQDADKLDAIGAFGILRCAAYSGAMNIPLHHTSTSPSSAVLSSRSPAKRQKLSSTKAKSTAIDHFHEKLFNLEGMMRTDQGKELARSRTAFMREFVDQVDREMGDAMLARTT